jgi:transcriptional regulator with XRE-family HTH domain
MTNFRKILTEAMEEKGMNQADVSKLTDIPQPTISRYLKKNLRPTLESLEKILLAFRDHRHRCLIAAGWLLDQIPADLRDSIVIKTPYESEPVNDFKPLQESYKIDPKTRQNLEFLLSRFEDAPEFADLLNSIVLTLKIEAETRVAEVRADYKATRKSLAKTTAAAPNPA